MRFAWLLLLLVPAAFAAGENFKWCQNAECDRSFQCRIFVNASAQIVSPGDAPLDFNSLLSQCGAAGNFNVHSMRAVYQDQHHEFGALVPINYSGTASAMNVFINATFGQIDAGEAYFIYFSNESKPPASLIFPAQFKKVHSCDENDWEIIGEIDSFFITENADGSCDISVSQTRGVGSGNHFTLTQNYSGSLRYLFVQFNYSAHGNGQGQLSYLRFLQNSSPISTFAQHTVDGDWAYNFQGTVNERYILSNHSYSNEISCYSTFSGSQEVNENNYSVKGIDYVPEKLENPSSQARFEITHQRFTRFGEPTIIKIKNIGDETANNIFLSISNGVLNQTHIESLAKNEEEQISLNTSANQILLTINFSTTGFIQKQLDLFFYTSQINYASANVLIPASSILTVNESFSFPNPSAQNIDMSGLRIPLKNLRSAVCFSGNTTLRRSYTTEYLEIDAGTLRSRENKTITCTYSRDAAIPFAVAQREQDMTKTTTLDAAFSRIPLFFQIPIQLNNFTWSVPDYGQSGEEQNIAAGNLTRYININKTALAASEIQNLVGAAAVTYTDEWLYLDGEIEINNTDSIPYLFQFNFSDGNNNFSLAQTSFFENIAPNSSIILTPRFRVPLNISARFMQENPYEFAGSLFDLIVVHHDYPHHISGVNFSFLVNGQNTHIYRCNDGCDFFDMARWQEISFTADSDLKIYNQTLSDVFFLISYDLAQPELQPETTVQQTAPTITVSTQTQNQTAQNQTTQNQITITNTLNQSVASEVGLPQNNSTAPPQNSSQNTPSAATNLTAAAVDFEKPVLIGAIVILIALLAITLRRAARMRTENLGQPL